MYCVKLLGISEVCYVSSALRILITLKYATYSKSEPAVLRPFEYLIAYSNQTFKRC